MSENFAKTRREEYPDDKSPEQAGCYMYAFYKLGLDPEEARMGVDLSQLSKFFTRVNSEEGADALALRHKINGRIDHIVFIDQTNGRVMKQRGNVGWPIEQTTLGSLLKNYNPAKYEYIYLKKNVSPAE